jgi:hypothetical protein
MSRLLLALCGIITLALFFGMASAIQISSYSITPSNLTPGVSGNVALTLSNTETSGLSNIAILPRASRGIALNDIPAISNLAAGANTIVAIPFQVLLDTASGVYQINLAISYSTLYTQFSIPITVVDKPVLVIEGVNASKEAINKGDEFEISAKLRNEGGRAAQVFLSLNSTVFALNKASKISLGGLDKNKSIDLAIDVIAAGDVSGGAQLIPATLEYQDALGTSYKETAYFTLNILGAGQTDFDVVVQDLSKTAMSLVVSNVGKNSAQSTTISIPEQEGFGVIGSSAQVVGTMSAGNNTAVSFSIVPVTAQKNLVVEIHYTDTLGVRRVVQKNVSIVPPSVGDFEVTLQDSTAGSVTLAVANVGEENAYSVAVSIPEQANFRVTGASTSVVGSLSAGEYTLATFQVASSQPAANFSAGANASGMAGRRAANVSSVGIRGNNLPVEISYTDARGIRRTVQKEVPISPVLAGGTNGAASTRFQGQGANGQGSTYIVLGTVGIVAVIAVAVFFMKRKRKK